MFEPCPCGAGRPYLSCCGAIHSGQRDAETPEQLMRARYSAFARGDADFLLRSWSLRTRPQALGALDDRQWAGLRIADAPTPSGEDGVVAFEARWRESQGGEGVLRERSRFKREAGRWVYVDGVVEA